MRNELCPVPLVTADSRYCDAEKKGIPSVPKPRDCNHESLRSTFTNVSWNSEQDMEADLELECSDCGGAWRAEGIEFDWNSTP